MVLVEYGAAAVDEVRRVRAEALKRGGKGKHRTIIRRCDGILMSAEARK